MRKFGIIILLVFFAMSPRPAYAVDFKQLFNEFITFFGIKVPTQAPPFETFFDLTPTPFEKPSDRSDFDGDPGRPEKISGATGVTRQDKPMLPGESRSSKPLLPAETRPEKPLLPADTRPTKPLLPAEAGPSKSLKEMPDSVAGKNNPDTKKTDSATGTTEKSKTEAGKNQAENRQPDAKKAALDADRTDRLKKLVDRMFDTFQNRLDNYTEFMKKVVARRDKLAGEGKDVAKLDAFIKTSRVNMAGAQASLTTAKSQASSLSLTGNPGQVIQEVRELLKTVRESFTLLHMSMSETVSEIVAASAGIDTKQKSKPTGPSGANPASTKSNIPDNKGNGNGGNNK